MFDLPVLVLREIFSFLGICDKVSARLAYKQWKFLIDAMRPQRNVCIHFNAHPYKEKLCFSRRWPRKTCSTSGTLLKPSANSPRL